MDIREKRKKLNFIIALGYCLVAVIILLNYVSKHKASHTKSVAKNITNSNLLPKDFDFVRKQLQEERRLNKEMRGALKTYQNAIKNSVAGNKFINIPAKVTITESIPVLKTLSTVKQLASPFSKGKNPYIDLNKRHLNKKAVKKDFLKYSSLKSDSKIPFLIFGSNNKVLFKKSN